MTKKRTIRTQIHIISAFIAILSSIITAGIFYHYWGNPFNSGVEYACPFLYAIFTVITINICLVMYKSPVRFGVKYMLFHYQLLCAIEDALIEANYCNSNENSKLVILPKIILDINKDLTHGILKISNSVRIESKLENDDLSSAMGDYVITKTYISKNRNYYVYEFLDINCTKQQLFNSYSELIEYAISKTSNYSLYIDDLCSFKMQSILLCGATGSGKTYSLYSLLLQVINKPITYHIFAIDLKNSSLAVIANMISEMSATNLETAISVIEEFVRKMEMRKEELKGYLSSKLDADYRDFGMEPFLCVIDEYASFFSLLSQEDKKTRDYVQGMIGRIILEGRQLGFHIWITMQKSDSNIITTAFRDNLTLKIVLGNAEDTTYTTTFGQGVDIPQLNYESGQGVFTEPSISSKPTFCSFPILGFDIYQAFKRG